MDYTMLPARVVLSLTGLSIGKIKKLTSTFADCWDKIDKKNGIGKNKKRSGRPRKTSLRHTLIYVLTFLKTNMTFDALSALFSLPRSTFHRLVKRGLHAVELAMQEFGQLPARDFSSMITFLCALRGKKTIFVDGTERPIRRPKKNQKNFYSGKKKCHTVKNQIVSDNKRRVLIVSQTEQGKTHDFRVFCEQQLAANLPKSIKIYLDSGYQGIEKTHPNHKILIPAKKRRNHELNKSQKARNKNISSKRIVVEHSIAGIKRMRAASDTCRSINLNVRDQKFIVCAALWNFYIAA